MEPCYALEVTGRGRWQVQRGACHHTLIREKEQRPLVVALFQTKADYTGAHARTRRSDAIRSTELALDWI